MNKKTVIIYASTHHGNTYKLVKAISDKHLQIHNSYISSDYRDSSGNPHKSSYTQAYADQEKDRVRSKKSRALRY